MKSSDRRMYKWENTGGFRSGRLSPEYFEMAGHGGKKWVESESGTGSDIKFTIPLCHD